MDLQLEDFAVGVAEFSFKPSSLISVFWQRPFISSGKAGIRIIPNPSKTINLGSFSVGQNSNTQTVNIRETGTAELKASIRISGPNASDFRFFPASLISIPDGGNPKQIRITCTPSALGTRNAVLQIVSNDPTNLSVNIQLTCEGVPPPCSIEVKLTAFDGANNDRFGTSVAISGNVMVVGAIFGNGITTNTGAVYIYKRSACGQWVFVKKIQAFDGATGQQFGNSVAISGDTVVVGAFYDDDNRIQSGSAYIFERNLGGNDNWGLVKKILPSNGSPFGEFGNSVTISGDTVMVAAHGTTVGGSVYIFERNVGGINNWGQLLNKILVASDRALGDEFGSSIALSTSGNTVVIGASQNDDNGNNSGSAYILNRNSGGINNWGEVKKISPSDGANTDLFGTSVAISGTTVVIGAHGNDDNGSNSGSAYIFEQDNGGSNNWGEVKKLLASDAAGLDLFGFSVAISGSTVVVGAHEDSNSKGSVAGSIYIYERDKGGSNNWGQDKKMLASDGAAFDHYGFSVAMSGRIIATGANEDDDAGSTSGSVYAY